MRRSVLLRSGTSPLLPPATKDAVCQICFGCGVTAESSRMEIRIWIATAREISTNIGCAWVRQARRMAETMEAVLRIFGPDMNVNEVASKLPFAPYRVDERGKGRSKSNCVYYDLNKVILGGKDASMDDCLSFLEKIEALHEVKARPDVAGLEVDFGFFIGELDMAKSFRLQSAAVQEAAKMGLSVTISVYKVSADE